MAGASSFLGEGAKALINAGRGTGPMGAQTYMAGVADPIAFGTKLALETGSDLINQGPFGAGMNLAAKVGGTALLAGGIAGGKAAYDYFSPGFTAWYYPDTGEYDVFVPPDKNSIDAIMPPGVYVVNSTGNWTPIQDAYVNCGYKNVKLDSDLNAIPSTFREQSERELVITDVDGYNEVLRNVATALPIGTSPLPPKSGMGGVNFNAINDVFKNMQISYGDSVSGNSTSPLDGPDIARTAEEYGRILRKYYDSASRGVKQARAMAKQAEEIGRSIEKVLRVGKQSVAAASGLATAAKSIYDYVFVDNVEMSLNPNPNPDPNPEPNPVPPIPPGPKPDPDPKPDPVDPQLPSEQVPPSNVNLPNAADDSEFMVEPDMEKMRLAEINASRKPLTKQDVITFRGGEDRRVDPSKHGEVPGYSGPYDSSTFEPWNPHKRLEAPFQSLTFWKGKARNPLNPSGEPSEVEKTVHLMYDESKKSWENVLKTHMPGARKLGKHLENYLANSAKNAAAHKRRRAEGRANEYFEPGEDIGQHSGRGSAVKNIALTMLQENRAKRRKKDKK